MYYVLYNLPFWVEVSAVVRLWGILLLELAAVLVEILVIMYGGLDLPDELLGAWACSVLRLRQLVHRCRVHVVDLTCGANDGTATALLSVNYCLSLGQWLRLRRLNAHSANLVHQRREVLRPVRRNDLCSYLLQWVLRDGRLQHRRLAHHLGRRNALCVVQVGHLSRHLLVGALTNLVLTLVRSLTILTSYVRRLLVTS
jgi:hypothetical protein